MDRKITFELNKQSVVLPIYGDYSWEKFEPIYTAMARGVTDAGGKVTVDETRIHSFDLFARDTGMTTFDDEA